MGLRGKAPTLGERAYKDGLRPSVSAPLTS